MSEGLTGSALPGLAGHTTKARLAGHALGTAWPHFQGPALPSPWLWEGALPCHLGDPHFRGHRCRWDRRTQIPEHTPWLRAGCYCSITAGASPSPGPGNSEVQVTEFIFSASNEIQSRTNNCVCFPHGFQSGITSYRKSQMLIKFASPLISNAVSCKFLAWTGAANLNTWCVQVLSEPDQKLGGNKYL